MKITNKSFGVTRNGEAVTLYTISNKNGMQVSFIDYGACIVNIMVPDKNGKVDDVVLGFDQIKDYENNHLYLGALVGRNANRIENARVELKGKAYELEKNDNDHNLHGGTTGYHKFMYDTEVYEEDDMISVEFSRLSPHLEQGFPGNLDLSVTYSLTENNELVIEYYAVSDQETVINLTNHSYFNLAGHSSGTILDHKVKIKANSYTPTNEDLIPTGEIREVAGTPMDFREWKRVGQDIQVEAGTLMQEGGYDLNYVLDVSGNDIEKVAEVMDEKSGRTMEIFTDLPGGQFYTAYLLEDIGVCKDGIEYKEWPALCFETQYYPNSCNIKSFPSCIYEAGKEYDSVTIYKFSW